MKTKKVFSRTLIGALAVMLFGTMLAPWASAQCGYTAGSKVGQSNFQPRSWQAPAKSTPAKRCSRQLPEPAAVLVVSLLMRTA